MSGQRTLPFGVAEMLAAVTGARRVLDVGCGSGRLTVALAGTGAAVTGIDTSAAALEKARLRADEAGVALTLVEADLNGTLPFTDSTFDAITSRLSLMIADEPAATLSELARTLEPGGRVATVIWAELPRNPWFAESRAAVAAVLGAERAAFARAFGKLGAPGEAAAAHEQAGLVEVEERLLEELVFRSDASEHWRLLAAENGHFRRVDETLDEAARASIVADLAARLERFRDGDRLAVPRALVLVTARRRHSAPR